MTSSFCEFILELDVSLDEDNSRKYIFQEDDFNGKYDEIGLAFARAIINSDSERYES